MNTVKQVIIVRKDLNMRKGKIAGQVAHASLGVVTNILNREMTVNGNIHLYATIGRGSALNKWLTEKFTKVVVYCNSEEELHELHRQAKEKNLLCCLIQDAGDTEFHGVPTYTTLAIGPAESEEIDEITGGLKLL